MQGSKIRGPSAHLVMRAERARCPICGGTRALFHRTVRDSWSREELWVHRCGGCTGMFLADPSPPGRIRAHYANLFGDLMDRDPRWLFRRLQRVVLGGDVSALLRRLPPGARILDLGSGDGALCGYLSDGGYRVEARDLSILGRGACPASRTAGWTSTGKHWRRICSVTARCPVRSCCVTCSNTSPSPRRSFRSVARRAYRMCRSSCRTGARRWRVGSANTGLTGTRPAICSSSPRPVSAVWCAAAATAWSRSEPTGWMRS